MDLSKLIDAAEWQPITTPWDEPPLKLTHHAQIELRGQQIVVWKLSDGRVLVEAEDVGKVLEQC